jgi:hypothetical protein
MEEKATSASPESGEKEPPDTSIKNLDSILTGVDLDTLPADVRDRLVANEARYQQTLSTKEKLEKVNGELTERAATHQSRADRAIARLGQHNIPLDGPLDINQTKPEDKILIKELTDAFVEEGLDPKVAAVYAKVHAKSAPILEKRLGTNIGRSLSPMVQAIGDMRADSVLNSVVDSDTTGAFQDEEIYNGVVNSVKIMAQAGNAIDKETIQSLLHMEIGKKIAAGKEVNMQQQQQNKIISKSQFSTRMKGGGTVLPNRGLNEEGGEPRAINADTQAAVQATTAAMLRGTGIKIK